MADPPFPRVTELGQATALPRVGVRAMHALNRLHDHRAAAIRLRWRDAPLDLRWRVDKASPAVAALRGRYPFKLGPYLGELALDAPTQALLLDEPRFAQLPVDLRFVLLADATHEWVDALVRASRLPFEWSPGATADAPFACAASFSLHRPDEDAPLMKGHLHLRDDEALDLLAPPLARDAPACGELLASLRFPLRFELGCTQLRLHELRTIVAGDIVSVEEWRSAGAAIVATATVGDDARTRWTALAEGTRVTLQQLTEVPMNQDRATMAAPDLAGAASAPASGPVVDRLDALEVTLRFEVGELEVTLGELRNIRPGHVFELSQPLNQSVVRILAHGNMLGKGHLVAVGEKLGVRVTEFAPNAL